MEQLFRECCDFIDSEYKRLGHTLGYRFLTCPQNLLNPDMKLLYLSQSPAGEKDIKEHPRTSCEHGSPFFVESWDGDTPGTSSLQRQTQGMFAMLQAQLKIPGTVRDFAEQHILSGYFVPFRCKGLDNLKNKKDSIESACNLWGKIFARWTPTHILISGSGILKYVVKSLRQSGFEELHRKHAYSGWQGAYIYTSTLQNKNVNIFIAAFPNLSHFNIFSREQCIPPFKNMLNEIFSPAIKD